MSAIMALHNGRRHCHDAVRSVLDQTHPPQEVIVVDDGSTDGSAGVVEAIPSPVPIKVVTQANQGQSAARNEGARIASGALLAFIDQDDLWHPRHVELLAKPFASRDDLGWAYSEFDEIDALSRTVVRDFLAQHHVVRPRALSSFVASDLMMLPSASVVRASSFEAVGGFDPHLCGYEDDDLFIRLFRAGWDSKFVTKSLTKFRIHDGNTSAGDRFRQSRVTFLDKLITLVPDEVRLNRFYIDDLVFPRLFQTTLSEYMTALTTGQLDDARAIAETAAELSTRVHATPRRTAELALLRRPELLLPALKLRRCLPPSLRPSINPALEIRPTGPRRP